MSFEKEDLQKLIRKQMVDGDGIFPYPSFIDMFRFSIEELNEFIMIQTFKK